MLISGLLFWSWASWQGTSCMGRMTFQQGASSLESDACQGTAINYCIQDIWTLCYFLILYTLKFILLLHLEFAQTGLSFCDKRKFCPVQNLPIDDEVVYFPAVIRITEKCWIMHPLAYCKTSIMCMQWLYH